MSDFSATATGDAEPGCGAMRHAGPLGRLWGAPGTRGAAAAAWLGRCGGCCGTHWQPVPGGSPFETQSFQTNFNSSMVTAHICGHHAMLWHKSRCVALDQSYLFVLRMLEWVQCILYPHLLVFHCPGPQHPTVPAECLLGWCQHLSTHLLPTFTFYLEYRISFI